jgi:hypothetical protein
MKLYATLEKYENGQTEGLGSNDKLTIELKQGNRKVGHLTFVPGHIEIWTKDDTGDHYWSREIALKGKKQKDECEHDETYYKYGSKCSMCGQQMP